MAGRLLARVLAQFVDRGRPEIIGPPDCPLMLRWTLVETRWGKVLVHRFLPDGRDPDTHDHPWPFATFVLAGGYRDRDSHGAVVDDLRRGAFRLRRAEYAHSTWASAVGAWTVVVAGRKQRDWGFYRDGWWWPFKDYESVYGFVMRCEDR